LVATQIFGIGEYAGMSIAAPAERKIDKAFTRIEESFSTPPILAS